MAFRAYQKDFIDYIKSKRSVPICELRKKFGDELDFLLRNHEEGGYIKIDNDIVSYIGDEYRLG